MKIENVLTQDENGEIGELCKKDYLKAIVKEMEVKAYQDERVGIVDPIKIVSTIFTAAAKGAEQAEQLTDDYQEVIDRITEDVEFTTKTLEERKTAAADEKAAAKKQKEEEKAKKEKDAAELAERQTGFVAAVSEGADKAAEQFMGELEALKENLPESVAIARDGDGYGINLKEGASDEDLGSAIGYFIGTSENSQFLANQIQWFIGDLAGAAVAKGLYKTALEASKCISTFLAEKGTRMAPGAIDTYRRMSDRTEVSLRNPKADPTAYLELSRMKRPKKGDKETKEAFAGRQEEFEKDIKEVQQKLSDGEILQRKEILPAAQEIKYKHGIEERPDPNEVTVSATDMLKIVVFGQIFLEEAVGNYTDEEGVVQEGKLCFIDPKNPTDKVWVTATEMEAKVEEAKSNLMNIFLKGKKFSVEEVLQGFRKEEKDVPVGTDGDGKAITEKRMVSVPVLIPAFFPFESASTDETENATD